MTALQEKIPVLDCAEIAGTLEEIKRTASFQNFAEKLGNGVRDAGLVYLVNHDVQNEIVEDFYSKARDFFALPKDVKAKYKKRDAVEVFHGFTPAVDEQLGEPEKGSGFIDLKEAFDFWGTEASDPANFPIEIPGLKDTVDAFRSSLTDLSKKLLCCFAIYLKLEDDEYFIRLHQAIVDTSIQSHNLIRTNYYFPINPTLLPGDPERMRLGAHCDLGTFTFLVQDEAGGLEAKMPKGGEWVPVPPIEGSLVFNAGLMLEMWSGGNIPATPHRVRAVGNNQSTRYRQSAGFFVQPDGTARCMPIVPKKPDWVCEVPYNDTETHYEYFRNRIRLSVSTSGY